MKRPGTYVGINYYTRIMYRWSALLPYLPRGGASWPGLEAKRDVGDLSAGHRRTR